MNVNQSIIWFDSTQNEYFVYSPKDNVAEAVTLKPTKISSQFTASLSAYKTPDEIDMDLPYYKDVIDKNKRNLLLLEAIKFSTVFKIPVSI